MNAPLLDRGGPRPNGVVDTLSAGFDIVNRRLWLLLLPILLDLLLWQAPQLLPAALPGQPFSRRDELGRLLLELQSRALLYVEDFNVLSLLGLTLVAVPSLLVASPGAAGEQGGQLMIEGWGAALGSAAGCWLGGMLLGSLYHTLVAQQVRPDGASAWATVVQAARGCWRMLGYAMALAGVLALFGLPVLFMVAGAALVDQLLARLMLIVAAMGWAWLWLYLFFVPEAVFVSRVGPLQAIKNSVAVVRASFWLAAMFMVLSTLILLGMGRAWAVAAAAFSPPWGVTVAILGNAYIASGLVAAAMVFYAERHHAARSGRATPALLGGPA